MSAAHQTFSPPAVIRTDRRIRVDCVGPLNVDVVIRATAPIDPGQLPVWVGPSEVEVRAAGPVGYTAIGLARLGCDVRVFSTVGADPFGRQLLDDLSGCGIDVGGIVIHESLTTLAIYPLLLGGRKRPMTYRLSEGPPWPAGLDLRADDDACDVLYLGGVLHDSGMDLRSVWANMTNARSRGVIIALDPQFPLNPTLTPWRAAIEPELGASDLFFCDEAEAASIFNTDSPMEAARAALSVGCLAVVIKMGGRGSLGMDAGETILQPAVSLGPAAGSAVGAGDAFNAGFIASWVSDRSLSDALRVGTAMAACWLDKPGVAAEARPADLIAMMARLPDPRPVSHGGC